MKGVKPYSYQFSRIFARNLDLREIARKLVKFSDTIFLFFVSIAEYQVFCDQLYATPGSRLIHPDLILRSCKPCSITDLIRARTR